AGFIGIDLEDIVVHAVGRPQANDTTSLNEFLVNQMLEHFLGIGIEIACCLADYFIIEYLWILAGQLPTHEEGRPVDAIDQCIEIVVIEHLEPGEGGLGWFIALPVELQLALAGTGIVQVGSLGAAFGIALTHLVVLFPDFCYVAWLELWR